MQENKRKTTDEELVAQSQSGDKQATEELLLKYSDLVRGCARGFFLVGGETEDLIQEGMIGLYHAVMDYKCKENNKSFKNFAYLCVSRKIIDALKKSTSKKNKPLNDSVPESVADFWAFTGPDPEESMILSDDKKEFKRKMSGVLSDFEFKIIMMYMDGMTCAQICEATGRSAKSVDNAIQRSKKKLQQLLNK